jgi:two-component system nitrate/nitrite response regulator NarL
MALRIEGYDARRLDLQTCDGPSKVLPAVIRMRPRAVLLDLDLGSHGSGLDLIQPLSMAGVAVIVVTSAIDNARWGECVSQGARKVIPKSAQLGEILGSIRRMVNGLPMMTPRERDELIQCWQRNLMVERELQARLAHLTHGEAEVLGYLMMGKQVGDIAKERFVSESTVRTQVKAVLAKLQVGSQLTAVGLAHKANWSPPPSPVTIASHATRHIESVQRLVS